MIGAIRVKMGPKVIGLIIGVISFVFIFYGIFVPGSGSQGPSVAGEVNGETISYTEFSRALNQRIEFMKSMMGGKVSDEQLEQFHIREAVFQDLAQKKILSQIARKEGFYPSMAQIRDQIMTMTVFQKDGHFDKLLYKEVLSQNHYSPTHFEDLIGQDIMDQNFRQFLGSLATVSDDEVSQALKTAKNRFKVEYVYVDNESVRKLSPMTKQKMKPEEQSKVLDQTAEKLGEEILPALTANQTAKIQSVLKRTSVKVKTSDWLSAQSEVIPGVGSIRPIQADLLSMKKGDPAKKFALIGGVLYAKVVDQQAYDPSKVTAKEKADAMNRLQYQKQSEIMAELIKSWAKSASIQRNDKVILAK